MQKIPTVFMRSPTNPKFVTEYVNPDCQWVIDGEGIATVKWDGTCCAVIGGVLYKRLHWKEKKGPAPAKWIHHSRDPDQRSGHGWYPVGDGPEDALHRQATIPVEEGTYELCGPGIQKNPHGLESPTLVRHGTVIVDPCPRTYERLMLFLVDFTFEGVVFHHPDGRMAKAKRRDFGLPWPIKR